MMNGYENIEIYDYEDIVKPYRYYDFGYVFNYKNASFKYSIRFKYLLVITHVAEILEKDVVTLSDKSEYKNRVLNVLKEILKGKKFSIELHRIDYKVDIKMYSQQMLDEYIKQLNKHNSRFHYMKKRYIYGSSIYLTTKTGQLTFNFYDKYKEQLERKGKYNEKFKYVLRLEIQNRPAKLKAQLKRNNKDKTLDNYYCKEGMEENYFDLLSKYLYEGGDYYRIGKAKRIINSSRNSSKNWKKKLKKFLEAVDKNGTVQVTYKNKYCCEDTGKVYIEKLNKLGINPITLDNISSYNKLDNLVKIARDIAKNQYYK